MATFALDGPTQCSGLNVVRYNAESLRAQLGDDFRLRDTYSETHTTPSGGEQRFSWCWFQEVRQDGAGDKMRRS